MSTELSGEYGDGNSGVAPSGLFLLQPWAGRGGGSGRWSKWPKEHSLDIGHRDWLWIRSHVGSYQK